MKHLRKSFFNYKFLLILLVSTENCFTQAPSVVWQNSIGGIGYDYGKVIKPTTSDLGFIVAGISTSNISGDKTEPSFNGSYDLWILKLNSAGSVLWQNTIGGNGTDGYDGLDIIQTSDGGYFIGATSESGISGDKTEPAYGDAFPVGDFWIIKLDEAGNIEWQNTIGGAGGDRICSVTQVADGGYILAGSSNSPVSYDKTEDSWGDFEYWIIKVNAGGIIEWQNSIGGGEFDFLNTIRQTPDGGFILGGNSSSDASGDKTEENIYSYDYWVIRLDAVGNIVWQNTIGGLGYDSCEKIELTSDGGFLLGGYSSSGVAYDKTEPLVGGFDYWVVKIDSTGVIQWDRTYGAEDFEYLSDMLVYPDDGFVMGGFSDSGISGDKTQFGNGWLDYWLIRLDADGNIIWDLDLGGWDYDALRNISFDADGGILLAGESNSPASGDKTEPSNGVYDYWVMKLAPECNYVTWYADHDADGFGDHDSVKIVCEGIIPSGFVTDHNDCNDNDDAIYPSAIEICNSLDDNCNGSTDEGLPMNTYFFDADDDTFGTPDSTIAICDPTAPSGFVTDNTDCDDTDNSLHLPVTYFADNDGDLFGDATVTILICSWVLPDGYVNNYLDCNDEEILINPVTNEVCNNVDDNCNLEIDEGLPLQTLYIDSDGDGFGDAATDSLTCMLSLPGYVINDADCNDGDPLIYPGAPEVFNGADDNCNQLIDEGLDINGQYDFIPFSVSPNPALNKVTVRINDPAFINSDCPVMISDLSGKMIMQSFLHNQVADFDISDLAPGLYLISISTKEGIQCFQKLVVE